ncbi:hypothetical protein MPSEU_000043100 [Mayamaea pseudoterrestris]|nr:hypothetical protein MPSEU_000043100 [Mayamaea pseudoterrestris]
MVILLSSQEPLLTAAELLRRNRRGNNSSLDEDEAKSGGTLTKSALLAPSDAIDDEIQRLERELQLDDGSSSDSESSSEDEDTSTADITCSRKTNQYNLSRLRNERIEPLPLTCLPSLTSKRIAAIDKTTDDLDRPSKKHKTSISGSSRASAKSSASPIDPDIQQSVQAMLQEYVPRSRDKLPFYCRFCQHQYDNEDAFRNHFANDFHKAAVQVERKATYCKLCQKQMTSPTQMQEHLSSGPHKERLQYRKGMQQQQQQQNRNGNRESSGRYHEIGSGGGPGRGGDWRRNSHAPNGRRHEQSRPKERGRRQGRDNFLQQQQRSAVMHLKADDCSKQYQPQELGRRRRQG